MKIVIAGGRGEADFLIGSLLSKNNTIKVINDDLNYSNYLADKYSISVLNGDSSKEYILEDADIIDYDVLVALNSDDADNFVTCLIAKNKFNIDKVVCTVVNPVNVDVFKKLGINSVISSTYTVAKLLEQATTFESLVNTLSSDDSAFSISEVTISQNSPVCNMQIKNIKIPNDSRISCITRNGKMVIPTGQTVLKENDRVLILSSKECHDLIIGMISGGVDDEN